MGSVLPSRPSTLPTFSTWVLVTFPALKNIFYGCLFTRVISPTIPRYSLDKKVYYHPLITQTFFLPSVTAEGQKATGVSFIGNTAVCAPHHLSAPQPGFTVLCEEQRAFLPQLTPPLFPRVGCWESLQSALDWPPVGGGQGESWLL